jgi:hypothetical protein
MSRHADQQQQAELLEILVAAVQDLSNQLAGNSAGGR